MHPDFVQSLLNDPLDRALIVLDREGEIVGTNASAREWLTPARRKTLLPALRARLAEMARSGDAGPRRWRQRASSQRLTFTLTAVRAPGGETHGHTVSFRPAGDPNRSRTAATRDHSEPADAAATARWRYLMEDAPDGFWDWDLDSDRVYYSPRYLALLGHDSGDFDAGLEEWSSRIHPGDRARVDAALKAHFEGRLPVYLAEHRLRHRDGGWRWMLDHGRVIERHPDGRPRRMLGTLTDISAYKALEAQLREREALLQEAQRVGDIGAWAYDPAADVSWWSDQMYRIYGLPEGSDQRTRARHLKMYTPESHARLMEATSKAVEEGVPYALDLEFVRPDGERRWVNARCERLLDEVGHPRLVGVVQDITEQRRRESQARWQAQLLERISVMGRIGGFDWDLRRDSLHWTDEIYRIHDLPVGSPLDRRALLQLYDPDSQDRLQQMFARLARGDSDHESADLCLFTPGGRRVWLHCQAQAEREGGRLVRISGLQRDITAEREAGDLIEQLAHYDSLTGLPNRFLFRQRAQAAIQHARRRGQPLAVLFVDLDRFKNVNDSLGHQVGDQLLFEVAGRLRGCVRSSDLVGRHCGDEFLVLLASVRTPEDAALVARKILEALSEPVELAGTELRVGASVGIALLDEQTSDLDALLRAADTAMYAAKDAGRNTFAFYSEEFRVRVQRRMTLENELRLAIARDRLRLVYQPTIYLHSGAIAGIEALLRWIGEDGEQRMPQEFIPIAEDCGEILPIGDWVLEQACRQAQQWREAGLEFQRLAVNVSAVQLRDAGFAPRAIRLCTEAGWPPEALQLELTESALMRESEALRSAFNLFERHGVSLAVDDFGTGFSNLHYLNRFPVRALKIDRSFTDGLLTDVGKLELARAIIGLGHALDLQVVAEGVETAEVQQMLHSLNCDEAQGYHIARPMEAESLSGWLRARQRP